MRKQLFLTLSAISLFFIWSSAGAVEGYGDSPSFYINGALPIEGEEPPALDEATPPDSHYLAPCNPNPFNPTTTIKYGLSEPAVVELQVYDLTGRLVRTLVTGEGQREGRYEVVWNGQNALGQNVASGVYLYRLIAGNYSEIRRMTLVK